MIDQNGQQPIQIRVQDKNKRTFYPTHIKVEKAQFKEGRIVSHPRAKEWNDRIKTLIIQYQSKTLAGEKKTVNTDFYKWIETKLQNMDRKDGTMRQYQAQISKLKVYSPTLMMNDFTDSWFNGYKKHLKSLGNSSNTIWSSFKFLNTFLHHALADGVIKEDPFKAYEMPRYKDPVKTYLTWDEIKKIEKYLKVAPEKIKSVGYWFLIACYTGMRISDIKNFNKKKIVNGDLVYQQVKTGEIPAGIPVRGKLKEWLKKVGYEAYTGHENTYNTLLKVIIPASGIDKHVSSHTARHTAAMLLADAGVSQEVTAKILGHSSLKSTSVYYQISNKRVKDEWKRIGR